jgi:hypothetical protein
MKWLTRISRIFAARKIATGDDLRDIMESRAAYLVQKSISEYTQARANMMFSTLLGEKVFQAAYDQARWRAFPAGMSMVAEVLMGRLIDAGHRDKAALATMLGAAMAQIVARYPVPQGAENTYWADATDAAVANLARAALGEPKSAHAVARPRAKEIFDALPVHEAVRKHDFEMFSNTLAFHLTAIATELSEMDFSALVRER